jgi:lambda family phage minor tail protein L
MIFDSARFMMLWGEQPPVDLAGAAEASSTAAASLLALPPATAEAVALKGAAMGLATASSGLDVQLARWLLVFGDEPAAEGVAPEPSTLAMSLARLRHSAVIELFVVDATSVGGEVMRFHAGVSGTMRPVVWQGETYMPYPVQVGGFAKRGDGSLPRPTAKFANPGGILAALIRNYQGLKGARMTRKRTLARYLDAVNFADGNVHADPSSAYPDDVYTLDRIVTNNRVTVEYELASLIDVQGVMLPRRQVLHSVCLWRYRGAECGYTGPAVAKADDTPTTVPSEDKCSQRLSGCRRRAWPNNELPFGGFPGAGVLRNG